MQTAAIAPGAARDTLGQGERSGDEAGAGHTPVRDCRRPRRARRGGRLCVRRRRRFSGLVDREEGLRPLRQQRGADARQRHPGEFDAAARRPRRAAQSRARGGAADALLRMGRASRPFRSQATRRRRRPQPLPDGPIRRGGVRGGGSRQPLRHPGRGRARLSPPATRSSRPAGRPAKGPAGRRSPPPRRSISSLTSKRPRTFTAAISKRPPTATRA